MTDRICNCPLFEGLSGDRLSYALDFFRSAQRSYSKGEFLNRIGEPLDRFGLVLSGTVQVYMDDIDGDQMIMATVPEGGTFGESLCYLRAESPVYICAATDCSVLWMRTDGIYDPRSSEDIMLAGRFTAMLARRALQMNDRIQVLSKLTLRDKLKAFFSQYSARFGSSFDLPMSRGDLALYLGSDRSSLSRELSRMKADGIIDFRRNHFTIL